MLLVFVLKLFLIVALLLKLIIEPGFLNNVTEMLNYYHIIRNIG